MSSNQVPIYSQVLPKTKDGQHGGRPARQVPPHQQQISPHSPRVFSSLRYDPRTPQPGVTDPNFDPLNHNHGGNFGGFANQSVEAYSRVEKFARESARRSARELGAGRTEQGGRQGRRDRQATHVRQAEHRINLRSLSLNEHAATRTNTFDRTPTEFVGLVNPYREAPRDYIPKDAPPIYRERDTINREAFESIREHLHKENSKNSLSTCHEVAHTKEVKISNREGSNCPKDSGRIAIREISSHSLSTREQPKSSSRETSKLTRENLRDFAAGRDTIYENEGGLRGCLQAEVFVPDAGNRVHSMKKSNSANKIGSVASGEKRKFYCREWAFQKLAHCLEQRPVSKTCGALILGDAGSGKTALCKELSQPGSGPSARQQRALQRRMIARHFLQGQNETSLTMGEFIRTLVMQILNNSSEHRKSTLRDTSSSTKEATIPEEEKVEASAPSAPPLDVAEERARRPRGTMERIHEREQYDDMLADIVEERLKVSLSIEEEKKPPGRVTNTNPFLPNFQSPNEREQKLYENHENVFLRNLSQQPKDVRNSRLFRQQSEPPLMDKKSAVLQKSLSTDSKNVQEIRPRRNSTELEMDLKNYDGLKNMEDAKLSSASKSLFKEILEADVDRRKDIQERKNSDGFDCKDLKTPLSPGGSNVHMAAVKVSRIPVASFKYPNMSVLSSAENSPSKSRIHRESERNSASDNSDNKESSKGSTKQSAAVSEAKKSDENDEQKPTVEDELPEYQNILKPPSCPKELSPKIGRIEDFNLGDYRSIGETILNSPDFDSAFNIQKLALGEKNLTALSPMKNTAQHDDVPPPIPSLPVNPRTLIANCYYEKLLSEPEIQQALLPQNLEKNPDDCFKKAILFPLLEIDPPKQCLFLLVDSIDETPLTGASMTSSTLTKDREKNGSDSGNLAVKSTNSSKTIAELLANHHHLFPQWLLLVCTARKQSKYLTKMFTGFRKISLDDLRRGHVTLDVQRYILGRLDSEPRLGQHVSRDAAQALDHLRIKSNGCFLYLERVLDGLADGSVALREIREIPGTLNGLYMWLCQRLFHGRKFAKVQPLLNVLLVAKCGVDSEILYRCLLTTNHTITREDFNKRLHLLRRILTLDPRTGVLSIFHHSFSEWLLDVKHCTRRFLCSEARGHAALTMYYTLHARSLNAGDVHRMVLHATRLEHHLNRDSKSSMESSLGPQMERSILVPGLDLHTLILLWILDSGCDVRASLKVQQQRQAAAVPEETPVATIPEFLSGLDCPTLPRDCRVLRALLEMGAQLEPPQPPAQPDIGDSQISLEQLLMLEAEEEEDEECGDALHCLELFTMDQSLGRAPVHTLAQNGEADSMAVALQAYVSAGGLLTLDLVDTVDRAGHTALQLAARAGRAAAAGALLLAGAAASLPDPEGWTPLRAAAWAGHTQVVELLLKRGCEVDCVDSDHRTALRAAAWSGHEEIVRLLIAHGADVNKTDLEGRTALIAAAYMGHTDIVTHLLDHGADIDHADADGRTALAVAALCSAGGGGAGGGGCAQLLLERGAAPARPDKDGMTPLLVAAFEGHKEVIELLLEAEADPEAADRAGRTPLWAAAAAGHAPAVRALLFWGCCVDTIDRDGRTVLSVAAAQGNVEVVRQLVDRGLDEHHRDNAGWTPLHYAAFEGHLEVCDVLLEAGAKVDEKDNDGKGPLMLAAQEGHCRLMELLIDEWGAPVDQHAHDGKTALRVAALEGHYEAVRILVERGAAVDALDADQRSTLYILALDNRISMARYLIQRAEANVETRDSEGRTPLHVSAWQGHYEMVNLLLTVGECNMDARDGERRTPLHSASWRGQAAVVRLLLSKGADPNAQCDQGATPLGIASQEGHEECVLWLLQHGANPKHSDHCGRTPAKVALRAGHLHVCRLLERWGATPAIQSVPNLQPELAGTNTSGSTAETKPCTASLSNARLSPIPLSGHNQGSPDSKRRSVHSSNSTKSSSNLTSSTVSSSHREAVPPPPPPHSRALPPSDIATEPPGNRSGLALTFAQQVARCGRRGGGAPASPLYATPPHSPLSDVCSPTQPQLSILSSITQQFTSSPSGQPNVSSNATDRHFCRDTHMRIILGRENKHSPPTAGEHRDSGGRVGASNAVQSSRITCRKIVGSIGRIARRKKASSPIVGGSKSKRNGIVTNPAMRLVANVRNGLDTAAANIRRTGVALAASASSNNPAVKTNAFQWRRETPL